MSEPIQVLAVFHAAGDKCPHQNPPRMSPHVVRDVTPGRILRRHSPYRSRPGDWAESRVLARSDLFRICDRDRSTRTRHRRAENSDLARQSRSQSAPSIRHSSDPISRQPSSPRCVTDDGHYGVMPLKFDPVAAGCFHGDAKLGSPF